MLEYDISINSIHAVKEFVTITNMFDFEIDLISGRYSIDAKSIMGIFSLNLEKPLHLTAHTDSCPEFERTISKFVVESPE